MNYAISVIIPCRNEGARIDATLADLAAQEAGEPFEVVVADGSDGDEAGALAARVAVANYPFALRVIANPQRTIPAALNRAIGESSGDLIIRIDAHARLPADYLRRMAAHLRQPGIDVAGPQFFAVPANDSLTARTICWCQNTRLGNGGTLARNTLNSARRVAHSPMSCYRRAIWQQLGGYDEALLSNEDFEFDWRANRAGFAVWSMPDPEYRIVSRGTLAALARQRWRYGRWKAAVVWKHPRSLSLRQALPPVAVIGLVAVVVLSSVHLIPWWTLSPLSTAPVLALFSLLISGVKPTRHLGEVPLAAMLICMIYPIIHIVWAMGMLIGILRGPVRQGRIRVATTP